MSAVVWAGCTAHASIMLGPRNGDEAAPIDRVHEAWRVLGENLANARPDVLVVIATDHFCTFSRDVMPSFAIGVGDRFRTWGDGHSKAMELSGVPELGEDVAAAMVQAGIDLTICAEMRLDHSFAAPIELLLGSHPDVPILPMFVNCGVEPMPTLRRAYNVGIVLGQALSNQHHVRRVAVLGTGGLSHWVGLPQAGKLNPEFDRWFLDCFTSADYEPILNLSPGAEVREAGNGMGEVRNWMVAAGTVQNRFAEVTYQPIPSWITGIGMVQTGLI